MFGAGSNFNVPRPTKAGNIGPPKLRMPSSGGMGMPRQNGPFNGLNNQDSSLGPKLKPLPKFPMHSMKGTANSLIQSQTPKRSMQSGVGLDLLK